MLSGIQLTLLIGPTVPVPAPVALAEALTAVEVTHSDEGRSGFQLTFEVGRAGRADLRDFTLVADPLLDVFSRVVLTVGFDALPRVLMDGFITRRQLSPSDDPGASTFTVTGEDVSVMMDLREVKADHPGQDEATIAQAILARYQELLLTPPHVVPPPRLDAPSPDRAVPQQNGMTDLRFLTELAGRFGFVFHVTPGAFAGQNVAYWGPPDRLGLPQPALSVSMGPDSNVDQISFQHDGLAPTTVADVVRAELAGVNFALPVIVASGSRIPPLAAWPAPAANLPNVRVSLLGVQDPPEGTPEPRARAGMSPLTAYATAQAKVDASVDKVLTATGQLDALRYGGLLTPRGVVAVRGAGDSCSGLYRIRGVSHAIRPGEYKQRFTLTREGLGSTVSFVQP